MAKQIAKGQITISDLTDGFYTIRLAPPAIIIPANSDGSNPVLTSAKTRVILSKDATVTEATITSLSPVGCAATFSGNEVTITSLSAQQGKIIIAFTSTDGYSSSTEVSFLVSKQGESGLSITLSNEAHALPANHDGSVSQASIDLAVCSIAVRRGSMPLTPVASNATPGLGQYRYNIQPSIGGTAARVNNNTFKLSTITASTCVIKVLIYAESLSNPIEKEMVITKVVGSDPTEFNEVKSVFDGWKMPDKVTINGAMLEAESVRAAAIIVETLFAKHFQTNNVGARTTINVLPTDSNNPTSNENYYKENAIRQYHESGKISMYEGIVTGVVIKVNGVNRTVNGHAKVVFKDEAGSPILYVVDSYTQNGGLQYNSNADSVQYFQITGHRLLSTNLPQGASEEDLTNLLFTYNVSQGRYFPSNTFWCGFYQNALYTLSLGLLASTGSVWHRVSSVDGNSFVTANNGTSPITSGWYYRLGDYMEGIGTFADDFQMVFNLNIQLQYINSVGKIGATKNLTINNIRWYQGGTGSNTCTSITPQTQIFI